MHKTAECVSPKHPDKICDQISDGILDACLTQDKNSRVAIETMGGHGIITITGEMTTNSFVDCREIAKKIAGDRYGVQTNIVKQSQEIANGVDTGGAGDQGIMIGYACNDNEKMIPQEIFLARSLCQHIYKKFPYDGKTQITIDESQRIVSIVASFQNAKKEELEKECMIWASGQKTIFEKPKIFANPAGDWKQGGFEADTGLTGRKIAVDNYGPQIPIGGGCFSGKDYTKVDRSAAYAARKESVEILRDFLENNEEKNCKKIEVFVKLAYSIGIENPVMATGEIFINEKLFSSNNLEDLYALDKFSTKNIVESLKLKNPQFQKTAEWGHFGNDFEWDK